MIKNHVWETTTTTGTGNITLAGAKSADVDTFNTSFGTNRRFRYVLIDTTNNDREEGIGYLSAATTLVRELVIASTNSDNAVNLSAGTKDIFISADAYSIGPTYHGLGAALGSWNTWAVSTTEEGNFVNKPIPANIVTYNTITINFTSKIDGLGLNVVTANGTSSNLLLAGIYDRKPDGGIGDLIVQAATFDPSSATMQVNSVTPIYIPPGVYWTAVWSNASPTVSGYSTARSHYGAAGFRTNTSISRTLTISQTGLLTLPSSPHIPTALSGATHLPVVYMRLED